MIGYGLEVTITFDQGNDWAAVYVGDYRTWEGHYSDLTPEDLDYILDGRSFKLKTVRVPLLGQDFNRYPDKLRLIVEHP